MERIFEVSRPLLIYNSAVLTPSLTCNTLLIDINVTKSIFAMRFSLSVISLGVLFTLGSASTVPDSSLTKRTTGCAVEQALCTTTGLFPCCPGLRCKALVEICDAVGICGP
ncbi:unnamed protein product [Somion occarium]|uniref:Granulins domain-containing protein n=1 Tax=Somion occarium TaxID=3059160 RepID=A0ABP1DU83_9APHY